MFFVFGFVFVNISINVLWEDASVTSWRKTVSENRSSREAVLEERNGEKDRRHLWECHNNPTTRSDPEAVEGVGVGGTQPIQNKTY